eukprot:COSAG01_NODE_15507_length_1329_cov_1.767480_3_plen_84_part_01
MSLCLWQTTRLLERSNYSLCLCAFRIHSAAVYTRFLSLHPTTIICELPVQLASARRHKVAVQHVVGARAVGRHPRAMKHLPAIP